MELPAIPGGRRPLGLSTLPPSRLPPQHRIRTGRTQTHFAHSSPNRSVVRPVRCAGPTTSLERISADSAAIGSALFSDATRRGVYHNNVECMRNELIPRHRLIENRIRGVYTRCMCYIYIYIPKYI